MAGNLVVHPESPCPLPVLLAGAPLPTQQLLSRTPPRLVLSGSPARSPAELEAQSPPRLNYDKLYNYVQLYILCADLQGCIIE